MAYSYPKTEKLKSRKAIDILFSQGKSVSKYPLRLVYFLEENTNAKKNVGVSVSKRYFKRAVDRNRIKRLLREAYRLNKTQMLPNTNASITVMLLYQNKEMPTFELINEKVVGLFEKLNTQINTPES